MSMRSLPRLLAGLCAASLVAGCQPPAVQPSPPLEIPAPQAAPCECTKEPVPPFAFQPVGDGDRLIAYYGYLTTLSAEQATREYDRTLRFYRQQSSDFTLMQLALLRIVPATAFRDSAQARDMLSSFLKEPRSKSSELRPLALMLNTMLFELQQKEAENQAQAQKLNDEARRYDEVKRKLDALIDAERKMLDRNNSERPQ